MHPLVKQLAIQVVATILAMAIVHALKPSLSRYTEL